MKTKLMVVFGGRSVEHEVAIISAVQAMNYLDKDKYDILPVYIMKDGTMLFSRDFLDINVFRRTKLEDMKNVYQNVIVARLDGKPVIIGLHSKKGIKKTEIISDIDVAMPIVHGTYCEDGTLQGWLEALGIAYCGCDVMSSAIGMDKDLFKLALQASNIPTLSHISFLSKNWSVDKDAIIDKIEAKFNYPVIVKPANLGSSVGISKAKDMVSLIEAVDLAASFAGKILVEPAVTNLREINCSVLGDCDDCAASECEEPVMKDEILSFQDKYLSSGSSKGMTSLKRRLPAEIDDSKRAEIQEISKQVFKLIGASGVVRIDYLMDVDDNNKIYVNEINTIPGSLSFYLWEASGLKYKDMLDRLIELAFKRERTRNSLMFTYDSNILDGVSGFGAKSAKGSKI